LGGNAGSLPKLQPELKTILDRKIGKIHCGGSGLPVATKVQLLKVHVKNFGKQLEACFRLFASLWGTF